MLIIINIKGPKLPFSPLSSHTPDLLYTVYNFLYFPYSFGILYGREIRSLRNQRRLPLTLPETQGLQIGSSLVVPATKLAVGIAGEGA